MKFLLRKMKCTYCKNKWFHKLIDIGRKNLKDRVILTPHLNVEPSDVKGLSQGHRTI